MAALRPAGPAAAAGAEPQLPDVQVSSPSEAPTETSDRYLAARTSSAATGLALSPQETPQPVTALGRQQLNDQRIRALEDIAWAAPGLSLSRGQLYARGFALNQVMVDGLSTPYDKNLDLSHSLAIYDRVEVIQGASGLMQGTGNPSAALNLVRKRPTRTPQLHLSASAGSWGHRGALLDVGGPLGGDGSLRGRFVADTREENSFQDVVSRRHTTFYGILEADLGARTTLSIGASQQKNAHRDSLNGIPSAPDGSDLHLPRSTYLGHDWERRSDSTQTLFTQLEHLFANGWQLKLDAQYSQADFDLLATYLWRAASLQQGLGQYRYRNRHTSWAGSLSGAFHWGGRQHQLALGASQRQQRGSGQGLTTVGFLSDIPTEGWNPSRIPRPDMAALAPYAYHYRHSERPAQKGLWLSSRFSLSDRLSLILGSRLDWFHQSGWVQDSLTEQHSQIRSKRHGSHYGGLVYDVDAQHSLYASVSDIFQPRTERDTAGQVLPPTEGRTWAAGVKGRYADQRLQAGLHLFQTTQQHQPEVLYDQVALCPSYPSVSCYRTSDQVRSQGIELELQGALTPAWQLSASYSAARSRYTQDATRQGQVFEPQLPARQLKLATAYRLPGGRWRVGGSLYRQSALVHPDVAGLRQPAYTLVGLVTSYQFSPQLQLQLQVSNLLDQRYYQNIETATFTAYGAPRSALLTLQYTH